MQKESSLYYKALLNLSYSMGSIFSYSFICLVVALFFSCLGQAQNNSYKDFKPEIIKQNAIDFLNKKPQTITDFPAERSEGGIHDYYSEGPYWWENPEDPNGPYIRRDGERNPDMYKAHRNSLKHMESIVCTLTAAFILTKDSRYSKKAKDHLNAWFVDEETFMNPSLLYAQAIKGLVPGRGIGLIDVIGFINVSNAILVLKNENQLSSKEFSAYQNWFERFGEWMTEHQYGIDEQNNNNNHSSWWGAQVASYALLADREDLNRIAVEHFKSQLEIQLASNGAFPEEMKRTRPYHYLTYTLESWAIFALLTSCENQDMWNYSVDNGNLKYAFDENFKYYENPINWTFYTELEKEISIKDEKFLWYTYQGTKDQKFLDLWSDLHKNNHSAQPELVLWKYILDNNLNCGK